MCSGCRARAEPSLLPGSLRPRVYPSLRGLESFLSCHKTHTTGIELVRENEAFATLSILVQGDSFLPINPCSQPQSFRVSSCMCFILVPSLCCLYLLFLFPASLHQLKHAQIQVVSF